jgi:hypothetical protein
MSAFEAVSKLVKEWQPDALPTELKYRDSLLVFLRERMKKATVEPEYRHIGTTIDIYVKQSGFFDTTEAFVELKRNLKQKTQLDRLVGQIESLKPEKNNIVVVLCGDTNPTLITRFKEKYQLDGSALWSRVALVIKTPKS